jgi:hypothetical protein
MISNPANMGHVVGFDPDGSVMVQWHGGRAVSGVDPRNLRGLPPGYAGRRVQAAREGRGYHVMTWGGGRYTSIGWYATRQEAEREVARIKASGRWSGMPPKVEAAGAPSTARHVREPDDDNGDEDEVWIDASDNEAPFLAQHWYSGQGDPLYALGSTGFPQPESTISWALRNAKESETSQWAAMEKKYGKKRLQKLMDIDPESTEARRLPDEKREDLKATDEISRLVWALQEALDHGERISAAEGLERQGVAPGTRW